VRVSFARPDHPIAYGYSESSYVFRQNFALYSTPRRWLRMAYCTTCLDGPVDPRGVVMQWGAPDAGPFLVSGQVWGEDNLIGRPAILDMPVGKGQLQSPVSRSQSRGSAIAMERRHKLAGHRDGKVGATLHGLTRLPD